MPIDYSIIIPAYNEEDYLPKTLAALLDAMSLLDLHGEIIVVDNNSTDRTAEIARTRGVRLGHEEINQISRVRNTGSRSAQGRYLIFVDADTLIPADLLKQALDRLENSKIIGGGACIVGDVPLHYSANLLLKLWNFMSVKTRTAAGSFIYCRRDDFEAVGGFSEAVYASEEVWFSRQLKKRGRNRGQVFEIIRQPPVITSMRKMEWYSPVRIYLYVLLLILFPFTVRIKTLCTLWYRRPHT